MGLTSELDLRVGGHWVAGPVGDDAGVVAVDHGDASPHALSMKSATRIRVPPSSVHGTSRSTAPSVPARPAIVRTDYYAVS